MKKSHLPVLLWGIVILIAFIFFSYLVRSNLFTNLDFDTTVKLQNKIPLLFVTPFSFLSLLGSFEVVSVILLIGWAIMKKMNYIFVLFFFGLIHFGMKKLLKNGMRSLERYFQCLLLGT